LYYKGERDGESVRELTLFSSGGSALRGHRRILRKYNAGAGTSMGETTCTLDSHCDSASLLSERAMSAVVETSVGRLFKVLTSVNALVKMLARTDTHQGRYCCHTLAACARSTSKTFGLRMD
jgi:hypothetical protein